MTEAATPDETAPELSRSALLVIDVQNDFVEGGRSPVPGTRAVLGTIDLLLQAYRASGRPIVHVVRLYQDSDVDLVRRRQVLDGDGPVAPGSHGSQIVPVLLPPAAPELDAHTLVEGRVQQLADNEIALWKPRWSAFYRTSLQQYLTDRSVTTVVIAGCNFPNCPRASAYDASARDLRVLLAVDATSGACAERVDDLRLIGAHAQRAQDIVNALAHP